MNLNPIGVMALLGGIVLVYAAVKNQYPQDVIREALGKKPLKGSIYHSPNALPGAEGHALVPAPSTPGSTTGQGTGVPIVTV